MCAAGPRVRSRLPTSLVISLSTPFCPLDMELSRMDRCRSCSFPPSMSSPLPLCLSRFSSLYDPGLIFALAVALLLFGIPLPIAHRFSGLDNSRFLVSSFLITFPFQLARSSHPFFSDIVILPRLKFIRISLYSSSLHVFHKLSESCNSTTSYVAARGRSYTLIHHTTASSQSTLRQP